MLEAAIRWGPRTAEALFPVSGRVGGWGFTLGWFEIAWIVSSQGLSPAPGGAPPNPLLLLTMDPLGGAGRSQALWRGRLP